MNCVFDDIDQTILNEAQAERRRLDALTSLPRTGDAIIYPDGTLCRVANSYHDASQPALWVGSFFVYRSGHMEYSGALTNAIPNSKFALEGYADVPVWFFHHGHTGAHRGVHCNINVRLWRCAAPRTRLAPDARSR